ncbi:hypothetical protein K7H91_20045 [Martelella mediterranea]|uniref:hypothetical protein n=1 Tax=Martelella mediterranea TaxID=293089 RepID=UPI001E554823|nr:hypothetical protein [Martelella mediterranea]MCD1636055.1 hypothetical protein [Martelella mediterranea]
MKPGMRGYVAGDILDWGEPITVASHLYYQANSGARCTRLDGEDWVFWKDRNSNTIFYKCGTDQTWPSRSVYPFRYSSDEVPGVATYRNQVHAAYKDPGSGAIYWSVYNRNWSDATRISNAYTNASPALAVYNDQLFLAWSTNDSTPTLSYCWFDGTKWSALHNTRYSIYGGPAMAAHNGELFFACARGNDSPIVYLRYANGTLSTPAIINANYISEWAPALASNGEELRMTWYGYPNLHALTTAWTRNSGWSAAKQLEKAYPVCSPGMYGDFSGFRIVWVTSYPGGVLTLSKTVDGCRNYWVSGKAMPDSWVTVIVTENSTIRSYPPVQADGNGAWSVDFDANLNDGDRIQATASFEKYGPQSDAFVWVIGQSQDGNNLLIRNVTSEGVSGYAPQTGQVIKGWRSSDGKLVVDYPLPHNGSTRFDAPYLFPGAYIGGDTINLVSQFPDDGAMTRFNGGPGRYSYP